MSRRRIRRESVPGGNVRSAYAMRLRGRWQGEPAWSHYTRIVGRLEAGEPVVVPAWAVARWVHVPSPERGGTSHVRLEPDGSVVLVEAVRVGPQIVGWERVA